MTRRCTSLLGRCLASTLTVLIVVQSCWAAQVANGTAAALRFQVLEGSNAVYTTEQVPDNNITVRLVDSSGKPVPDIGVVFTAPATGPGGEFPNGLTTITVLTDSDGRAVTRLYHPNPYTGMYEIGVRAEYNGQTATTTIRQRNITPQRGFSKKILIFAAVGAAAGAALAIGKGGGSPEDNPRTPLPSISFGNSSVGAPRP